MYDAGADADDAAAAWHPGGVLDACARVLDAVGGVGRRRRPRTSSTVRRPAPTGTYATLLDHLVWENLLWGGLAQGAPRSDFTADHLGDDHVAAFRSAAHGARTAVRPARHAGAALRARSRAAPRRTARDRNARTRLGLGPAVGRPLDWCRMSPRRPFRSYGRSTATCPGPPPAPSPLSSRCRTTRARWTGWRPSSGVRLHDAGGRDLQPSCGGPVVGQRRYAWGRLALSASSSRSMSRSVGVEMGADTECGSAGSHVDAGFVERSGRLPGRTVGWLRDEQRRTERPGAGGPAAAAADAVRPSVSAGHLSAAVTPTGYRLAYSHRASPNVGRRPACSRPPGVVPSSQGESVRWPAWRTMH